MSSFFGIAHHFFDRCFWYSRYFSMLVFIWVQSPWFVDIHLGHRYKSSAVKSGERAGQLKSPFFYIKRSRKNDFNKLIVSTEVWHGMSRHLVGTRSSACSSYAELTSKKPVSGFDYLCLVALNALTPKIAVILGHFNIKYAVMLHTKNDINDHLVSAIFCFLCKLFLAIKDYLTCL